MNEEKTLLSSIVKNTQGRESGFLQIIISLFKILEENKVLSKVMEKISREYDELKKVNLKFTSIYLISKIQILLPGLWRDEVPQGRQNTGSQKHRKVNEKLRWELMFNKNNLQGPRDRERTFDGGEKEDWGSQRQRKSHLWTESGRTGGWDQTVKGSTKNWLCWEEVSAGSGIYRIFEQRIIDFFVFISSLRKWRARSCLWSNNWAKQKKICRRRGKRSKRLL